MASRHLALAALLALLGLGALSGCPQVRPDDDDATSDDDDATGDDDDSTGNQAPFAGITSPADGATLSDPSAVNLAGTGEDAEDGTLSGAALQWASDVDGDLGQGSNLTVALSLGEHRVSLVATDSDGASDTASVDVTVTGVNQPPEAFIDLPLDGSSSLEGESIVFEGRGEDPEDGSLSGAQLVWSDSVDGALGSGSTVTLSSPTLGSHTIVLTAIDGQGEQGLASITIEVVPLGQNLPPTAVITAPANNSSYVTGDTVTFQGAATDPEDGVLSGGDLEWSSSLDGALGTGGTVATSSLSQGTHVVSLTATDSEGDDDVAQITVTVNAPGNTPPQASITAPAASSTVVAGSSVSFVGAATDAEDGTLSGAALAWSSSLDGALGTGSPLAVTTLSVGNHTVTLTATDSGGAAATDQVTVNVLAPNTPPSVGITAPTSGSSYTAGDPIGFVGTATDAEDGALSGAALVWSSNQDGALGTGASLTISSLSAGTHTVTLTGVDSGGLSSSDSISVSVTPAQVNVPPNAVLTGPSTSDTGVSLTFDGGSSTDGDGAIVQYDFDFGDGVNASGATASASHTYSSAGSYTVTLTVTDDDGATDTDTLTVVITEAPQLPVVVDSTGDFGARCSLALDGADLPHVIYRDQTHAQLWYGWDDGSQWNFQLVDGPGFDVGGQVSSVFSLAVDSQGEPHIAYRFNNAPSEVRYATWNGVSWTRELVNSSLGAYTATLVSVALDPANGERPTVAFTYDPGADEEPAVAYRTGAGSWTESNLVAGASDDYFLGDAVFDSAGALWLPFDPYSVKAVTWSAASGWGTPSFTGESTYVAEATLGLDALEQPIVMTPSAMHHLVGSSWISSAYESVTPTYFALGTNAAGDLRMGVNHSGNLELGTPTPFWLYDYQGPVDSDWFDVEVDSTGATRACFFRSGNLMVF